MLEDREIDSADPALSKHLAELAGRTAVSARATPDELAVTLERSAEVRVPLGGSVRDVSSYDVAVFHGADSSTPVSIWPVGE